MAPFVHLIADYGAGDPAFSEVVHRLTAADPEVRVQQTAVPPFSTVATGFWLEQLGLHNPPFDDLLVYSNTAPRTDDVARRKGTAGGRLCYLELDTGVPVVAVDAGYNLSFVRDRVRTCRAVETPTGDSQFRSRDYFPEPVVAIANGETDLLGDEHSLEGVPPPPDSTVCHVDGYGNVKTSIRASSFDLDADRRTVEIGSVARDVAVTGTVSDVEEGAVGLVPGSAGGDDPYLELFLRGGSAAAAFDDPHPGDDVVIR